MERTRRPTRSRTPPGVTRLMLTLVQNALWLTRDRDAEARLVRERVPHERIGRRARRFVVIQVYPRTCVCHSLSLPPCLSATRSWRNSSTSARDAERLP